MHQEGEQWQVWASYLSPVLIILKSDTFYFFYRYEFDILFKLVLTFWNIVSQREVPVK